VQVPLCYAVPTPLPPAIAVSYDSSGSKLYCVRFGTFRVVNNNSSTLTAMFVNGVEATGGQGGGAPQTGELRVVKLSD
jgi:hypothetical protein